MKLPHQPEELEAMRKRYPAAIEKKYNLLAVEMGLQVEPAAKQHHLFDFDDGLRIIISRDTQDGIVVIHFSGSIEPGWPLYQRATAGHLTATELLALIVTRFRDISGDQRQVHLVGLSPVKKVPHFHIFENVGNLNNPLTGA